MARFDHTTYQPMPLEIISWGVLTWPDQPDEGRPFVEGRFTRHPDWTFEVECVAQPSERTYQDTRLSFLLIKVEGGDRVGLDRAHGGGWRLVRVV